MATVSHGGLDHSHSLVRVFPFPFPSSKFLYSFFTTITTVYLLTLPSSPETSLPDKVSGWATFLGITAAVLAATQYAPQLIHTFRSKLVGALSIPMMMIQTPGGFLMVTSIVLRPGTNWTSTLEFIFSSVMLSVF